MRTRRTVPKNPPTFGQLQQTRMQNHPLRVRRKSSTPAGQDMASGTEPSEQCLARSIGERCPHPQIHFRQGRGGARELRRGVEVHTGNVLNRTDTEQSGPRAPVALKSFPAMSVTEARFWC